MLSGPHWIWSHRLCSCTWVPVAIRGLILSTGTDRQDPYKRFLLWQCQFAGLPLCACCYHIALLWPDILKILIYQTEVIAMPLQKPLAFQGSYSACSLHPVCSHHSGTLGSHRTSRGRGSRANRNTVFLLPQESWRACKSHCFFSPAPGDLW